jgi:2-keto-4-pentenoate hydratase
MSSIPREALKTRASKPGVIGVPSSTLSALARAINSRGSEMSAGVILFRTSAAA